jgi:hypothetical protein
MIERRRLLSADGVAVRVSCVCGCATEIFCYEITRLPGGVEHDGVSAPDLLYVAAQFEMDGRATVSCS